MGSKRLQSRNAAKNIPLHVPEMNAYKSCSMRQNICGHLLAMAMILTVSHAWGADLLTDDPSGPPLKNDDAVAPETRRFHYRLPATHSPVTSGALLILVERWRSTLPLEKVPKEIGATRIGFQKGSKKWWFTRYAWRDFHENGKINDRLYAFHAKVSSGARTDESAAVRLRALFGTPDASVTFRSAIMLSYFFDGKSGARDVQFEPGIEAGYNIMAITVIDYEDGSGNPAEQSWALKIK